MSENRELSEAEYLFCAEYVRNGGIGYKAAIAAGYAERSASVAAARLLRRKRVQDEIARRRQGAEGIVQEVIGKALATVARTRPTADRTPEDRDRAAMYAEAEKDIAAGLNRAYVVAGLIDNFEMALGRRPKQTTFFIKEKKVDAHGVVTIETVAQQRSVFEVDHAGANRAAELLLAECPPDAPDTAGAGDNSVVPMLEAFKAGRVFEVKPEKAKDAR